jgi:hypothetical protein
MTTIVTTPVAQVVVFQSTGPSTITNTVTTPQLVVSGLATSPVFRTIEMKVISDVTALLTGDLLTFCIPSDFGGMNLIDADAYVTTVSSSGLPTVQIKNVTQGNVNMLTTPITIDVGETTSYTAATPPVIDTANDDVATGDLVTVNVPTNGTGAKGLGVILRFA